MMFKRRRLIILILVTTIMLLYTMLILLQFKTTKYGERCRLPKMWKQEQMMFESESNMTDWSFQKITKCKNFSIQNVQFERKVISLQCQRDSVRLISRNTKSSADIFSIPFRNNCLIQFIDSCCFDGRKVPNVVHYIWFNDRPMTFFHLLSFLSVVQFVKPCLILIHGSFLPHGAYWDYFLHVFSNIVHVQMNLTTTIGGRKLAYPEHGSDIMRIQALSVYGGLYLDWDEVVLRPVDSLRDYPMTMGLELENSTMGSQFIMARKGEPFSDLWLETYRTNYRDHWSYNALTVPYSLSRQLPDLIHVESNRFTRPNGRNFELLFDKNFDWSDNYAMHLYARWFGKQYGYRYDETTIGMLNITLGSVARHVLFENKELCR